MHGNANHIREKEGPAMNIRARELNSPCCSLHARSKVGECSSIRCAHLLCYILVAPLSVSTSHLGECALPR
jgi:hypothetical protein